MPQQTLETCRGDFFASIVPLVVGGGGGAGRYDVREPNMHFLENYTSLTAIFNSHMQLKTISSRLLTNYVILHAVLH